MAYFPFYYICNGPALKMSLTEYIFFLTYLVYLVYLVFTYLAYLLSIY